MLSKSYLPFSPRPFLPPPPGYEAPDSTCIEFYKIPLAKASHVAKPDDRTGEINYISCWDDLQSHPGKERDSGKRMISHFHSIPQPALWSKYSHTISMTNMLTPALVLQKYYAVISLGSKSSIS